MRKQEVDLFGTDTIFQSGNIAIVVEDIDALAAALNGSERCTIASFESHDDSVLGGEFVMKPRTSDALGGFVGTIDHLPVNRRRSARTIANLIGSKILNMQLFDKQAMSELIHTDRTVGFNIDTGGEGRIVVSVEKQSFAEAKGMAAGMTVVEYIHPHDELTEIPVDRLIDVIFVWGAARSSLSHAAASHAGRTDIVIKSFDPFKIPSERDLVFDTYKLNRELGKRTVPELVLSPDQVSQIMKAYNPTKQILEIVLKEISHDITSTMGDTEYSGVITAKDIAKKLDRYYED